MRVLHLGTIFLSPDHPDHGRLSVHPGRWVLDHAIAQKRYAGLDAELVVQVPGSRVNHTTELDGVPVHYIGAPSRFRAATMFYFDARRLVRVIRDRDPDIVHAHGTEDALALAACRSRKPFVVTAQALHCMVNERLRPPFFSREKLVECTERSALRAARFVITKSDYVRHGIEQRFPHLKIFQVPNTLDERILAVDEIREPGTIVFVGLIDRRKGLHVLRAALDILESRDPGVSLWIIGNAPSAPSAYEAEELSKLRERLGSRLVLHGRVPHGDALRFIARGSLLVAPSLEEMFGNQAVEALLVRTPVVATEETAMADHVRRFGNGRVVPQEDPAALAAAVREMLESPPGKADAEQARQDLLAYMGPETVAARHAEIYRQILSE